jgi:hypothetical protein
MSVLASFEFSIGAYNLCSLESVHPAVAGYLQPMLPADFAEVVDIKGDRFRDAFTRLCLYLANRHIDEAPTRPEMVVVGTEYGNLEAMLRFQRQALMADKTISAQQFPHATTSSASTFVNISKKLTGGNVTLNAGALTPITALLHALLHLQAKPSGQSHVFVGDAYCAEAVEDICKRTNLVCRITPGVCYASLNGGVDLQADVCFGDDAFDLCSEHDSFICSDTEVAEHNGAFALYKLLSEASALPAGRAVSLGIQSNERRAAVRILRRMAA